MVEPPASSADAVTAPSRTIACASSQFVIPTLKPRRRPSTASRMIFPSARWPTAVRGLRGASCEGRKSSPAVQTGLPLRTIAGPPPSASVTPLASQSGERIRRVRIALPGTASAWSFATWEPRASKHRAVLRDRQSAAAVRRGDDAGQVGAGHGGRERLQDDLVDAGDLRRRGAPGGREERRAVAAWRLVQSRQRPALAEALPVAEERDAGDVELAVGRDADAGAGAVGRAHQHLVLHEHPGRVAVVEVEEVAVDAGDRRRAGDVLLHRGDALGAEDRPVREQRLQLVEPTRTRRGDHVQHHGPVRRELDRALEAHVRHEHLRSSTSLAREGGGEDCQQGSDEDSAEHDPGPRYRRP